MHKLRILLFFIYKKTQVTVACDDDLSARRQVHWHLMPPGNEMIEVVPIAILTDRWAWDLVTHKDAMQGLEADLNLWPFSYRCL